MEIKFTKRELEILIESLENDLSDEMTIEVVKGQVNYLMKNKGGI